MNFLHRPIQLYGAGILLSFLLASCATTQMPYHGFATEADLEAKDATVTKESALNGPMDPQNLAQDGQEYTHDGNAYDREEEGYYEWGVKLYQMGYRDVYYVADLAPKAMGHDIIDTYEHAIEQGFNDAAKNAGQN